MKPLTKIIIIVLAIAAALITAAMLDEYYASLQKPQEPEPELKWQYSLYPIQNEPDSLTWSQEGDHWVAQDDNYTYEMWNQTDKTEWDAPQIFYGGGGHPSLQHITECHENATPEVACSDYCYHYDTPSRNLPECMKEKEG